MYVLLYQNSIPQYITPYAVITFQFLLVAIVVSHVAAPGFPFTLMVRVADTVGRSPNNALIASASKAQFVNV